MANENVDSAAELRNVVVSLVQTEDFLSIMTTTLQQLMEAEVTALCGAPYASRGGDRANRRNGYRSRPLETRLGTVELSIPRVRQGSYFPSFLEPRRRWEQARERGVRGVRARREHAQGRGARGGDGCEGDVEERGVADGEDAG